MPVHTAARHMGRAPRWAEATLRPPQPQAPCPAGRRHPAQAQPETSQRVLVLGSRREPGGVAGRVQAQQRALPLGRDVGAVFRVELQQLVEHRGGHLLPAPRKRAQKRMMYRASWRQCSCVGDCPAQPAVPHSVRCAQSAPPPLAKCRPSLTAQLQSRPPLEPAPHEVPIAC